MQVLIGSMSHSSMGLSTTTVCTLSLHCTAPCNQTRGIGQHVPIKSYEPSSTLLSKTLRKTVNNSQHARSLQSDELLYLCQTTSTMLQLSGAQSCFGILVQEVSGVYFFTCCFSKVHTSLGHCTKCTVYQRGGGSSHLVALETGRVSLLYLGTLLLLNSSTLWQYKMQTGKILANIG